jgi:hypothetical protein
MSSILNNFTRAISQAAKTVAGVAETAFSSKSIGNAVSNGTRVVNGILNVMGTISGKPAPRIPSSLGEMGQFVTDATANIEALRKKYKNNIVPVINDLKMLVGNVDDEREVLDECRQYSVVEVAQKVEEAENNLNALQEVITQDENDATDYAEEVERPGYKVMSKRNGQGLESKFVGVLKDLLRLTPTSKIAPAGEVATQKPVPWVSSFREGQIDVETMGNEANPNGISADTGSAVASQFSDTVTSTEPETAYSSVSGNRVFTLSVRSNPKLNWPKFPPKPDCYKHQVRLEMVWKMDNSEAEGPGTPLADLFGQEYGVLEIYAGKRADTKPLIRTWQLKWGATADTYDAILVCEFDFDGDDLDIDFVLRADNVDSCVWALAITGVDLVGIPLSDVCDVTNVSYVNSDGQLKFLKGTERWVDMFGKISRNIYSDPNFSLAALWNDRSARGYLYLVELVQSLLVYSEERWGVGPTKPSINDKYVNKYGLGGMMDAARVVSYVYTDGPFSALDIESINEVYELLIQHVDLATRALYEDDIMSKSLVKNNAVSTSAVYSF